MRNRKPETSEYMTWAQMKRRCDNPKNKRYARYGGRGIIVCDRWKNFKLFLEDMGSRPSPKHSIERRDNDGNYEPSNCYWATAVEQANNVCRNHLVTYNGKQLTLAQLVRESGTPFRASRIRWRLEKGWSMDRALFATSIYSNSPKDRLIGDAQNLVQP